MENRQYYTDNLLEHYEKPRYYGVMPDADIVVKGENPRCGDVVTIYLKVGDGQTAERIQFEGKGCTISQASASILLEMVQGKTLAEIEALDYNDLIEKVGKNVILTRVSCATLSLSTLQDAVRQYQSRRRKPVQSQG